MNPIRKIKKLVGRRVAKRPELAPLGKVGSFGPKKLGIKSRDMMTNGFLGMEPETLYWDPMNFQKKGAINGLPLISEQYAPAIDAFDEARRNGKTIRMAWEDWKDQVKALGTADWTIPIFAIPHVTFVDDQNLPAATLVPRITTDKDVVQTTPETDTGKAEHFDEGDATYPTNDDVFYGGTPADYSFTVDSYGRSNNISDLILKINTGIQNPRQVTVASQLIAVRNYEETQIIQGVTGGDANGFLGIEDFARGTGGTVVDGSGGITTPDDVRALINTVRKKGAKRKSMVGFTDMDTWTDMANDLQTYVKISNPFVTMETDVPGAEFGMEAILIDKVPFFQSDGCRTIADTKQIVVTDFNTHYMSMVQDAMMEILAKSGPNQEVASSAYGTLTSEGYAHCGIIEDIP